MNRNIYIIPMFVFGMLSSCSDGKMDRSEEKEYFNNRESVRRTEVKYPEKFLSVQWHARKNILGQLVLEGKLQNKSTSVTYKEIELLVSFFGEGQRLTKEEREVVMDSIPPRGERSFKRKYHHSGLSDSILIQVKAAGHTGP